MDEGIHDRGRGPEVAGTRITVYTILHYLSGGRTTPAEVADLLYLTPDQMASALTYIDTHHDQVMADFEAIEARINTGNPGEIKEKVHASRVSFAKLRKDPWQR